MPPAHRAAARLLPAALALGCALGLAACATSDPVHFANGGAGYAISCPLGTNGLSQCYQKAASICTERGYTLRNWQGEKVSFNAMEHAVDAEISGFTAKSVLVECNQ